MNNNTEATYRYTVTITGEGGDFFFMQMTPEQAAYWNEKGNDALWEHLSGGSDGDGTPAEFALGSYEDADDNASGIGFEEEEADLVVRDKDGEIVEEVGIDEGDFGGFVESRRAIVAPPSGAFIRTHEQNEQAYELELSVPFDFDLLRIGATETPKGALVNCIIYDGREILPESFEGKEIASKTVELLSS